MVCVLPLPVCPYAITVQLKPFRVSVTSGATMWSNKSFWEFFGVKTRSKVKIAFEESLTLSVWAKLMLRTCQS